MGCKNAKENKKENSSYLTLDMKVLYDSKEFATTKQLIEASIKTPNKSIAFYLKELLIQNPELDVSCTDLLD